MLTLFLTRVTTFGIGVFNAFLFARLVGPAGKGEYYLLILLPSTVNVLVQLGIPGALGFYSAQIILEGLSPRLSSFPSVSHSQPLG